jgi:glycosyltransferase involved in cell wall biosynthesis
VSYKVSISMTVLLAGSTPFLIHQFSPCACSPLIVRAAQRLRWLLGLSKPALTLAVHDASWTAGIRKSLSWIAIEHLPLAGIRPIACDSRKEDARRALGIKADQSVALLFGAGHCDQDPTTVLEALKGRSDWQLIVAGSVARHFKQHDIDKWRIRPLVIEGFVEPSIRDCAYRAADVVLLSFQPNHGRNSGTLMDAVSYGCPVIVSDRSSASDLVRQWGLGIVFSCGSPVELSEALDKMDIDASRLRVLAAQPHMSNAAVATRHLETIARLDRLH